MYGQLKLNGINLFFSFWDAAGDRVLCMVLKRLEIIGAGCSGRRRTMTEAKDQKALYGSLKRNVQWISDLMGGSEDLSVRQFQLHAAGRIEAAVLFIDGLIETELVQAHVILPLMTGHSKEGNPYPDALPMRKLAPFDQGSLLRMLKETILPVGTLSSIADQTAFIDKLLSGNVVIVIDGSTEALAAELKGWDERTVQEPSSEAVVRGPREGFTENIRTNTAMLRRKIKNPDLWVINQPICVRSGTKVSIAYLQGTALEQVVDEVKKRLGHIDIDGLLESNQVEELIREVRYTPFPTIANTERPDVVAAAVLEGRVAIFVDGTPFVMMVPAVFTQFFQSAEDYYQPWDMSSLIRMLRYVCFVIALLAPSIYIAFTTFHQEMLPTILLISIASQREGVPFPAFIEALAMEITFEILREAGIRMPKTVGQAVSIVGTLVIGQAAVEAGIVSAAMVIVVAITAISSFVLPSFSLSISVRMLRFIFMALAASFGLLGITVGVFALMLHLCSLKSFTIPYMSPLAPYQNSDQKDTFIRLPAWMMMKRPRLLTQRNLTRQSRAVMDEKLKRPPRR